MSCRMSLVVSDRGCGWKVSRMLSKVSLVVLDCVCGWGVLLVLLDCGCGWEVSGRVLCGMLLVVFDRRFRWEVLCWEVAWRVSGGV